MTRKKFNSKEQKNRPKGFRISIYVRVSTEEQAENPEGSIKNQEERLREYVKLKNLMEPFGEVTALYSDPGVSAKDMNRPGFQKMLKAIERGEVDLVLVTELSRFSRSTKDFAILQEFLEENNCKFMSLRENFDTSGAAGSMVLSLMASIAEFERRQTAERISHSFLARAKRGLYNGGSVPLGYAIDPSKPGTLAIVPEEAELVRLFFQAFLKEKTLAATAKWLNRENIKTPRRVQGGGSIRGENIRFDAVYRILKNKSYLGIRVFKTKTGLEESTALWDPIIDVVTFERVQKLLAENCSRRKTHKNKFPFTLTGLIHCHQCGERMSGASATSGTGKRIGYYEHLATRKNEASLNHKLLTHKPRRIPALKIEPLVWTEVKKFILEEAFAKNLLDRARIAQGTSEKESRAKDLEQKRGALSRQVALLAERIGKLPESLDPKPLFDQLGELQQAQEKINNALVQVSQQSEPCATPISFESLEIFRRGLRELISKGENDPQVKSAIIKTLVHKIDIRQNGFEIHFHVSEAHYQTAPGNIPGASFFVPKSAKMKKPSVGSPTEGLKLVSIQTTESQLSQIPWTGSSRRLTDGGPKPPTCSFPLKHDFIEFFTKSKVDIFARCAHLYQAGQSLRDVSELTKIPESTIRENLVSQGVRMRTSTRSPDYANSKNLGKRSGHVPYGFCFLEGQLVKNPAEYETVLKIMRLWKQGRLVTEIAKSLNDQGLKTRLHKPWRHQIIKRIIKRQTSPTDGKESL